MTLVIVFILNFNLFRPLLRLHSNLSIGLLSHQLTGIHMMVVVTLNESGKYYAHTETSQLICIAKSIDWFLYENNNELIWDKYVLIFGWHFKAILYVGFGRMFLKIIPKHWFWHVFIDQPHCQRWHARICVSFCSLKSYAGNEVV